MTTSEKSADKQVYVTYLVLKTRLVIVLAV